MGCAVKTWSVPYYAITYEGVVIANIINLWNAFGRPASFKKDIVSSSVKRHYPSEQSQFALGRLGVQGQVTPAVWEAALAASVGCVPRTISLTSLCFRTTDVLRIGARGAPYSFLRMPNYRRANIAGGTYFFTVNILRHIPVLTEVPVRKALREAIRLTRMAAPFDIDA